eukprot:CAMPEP_0202908760 /NCGR_PEP_ID=MMETSP1392-20130828/47163_1 /ASSEMBLY_ACC=CAM_ASM_000868 /TAXON_ID=225041 /ORGANISM="Chlamydomonas chlamydogama, Strain SAG 11-48b" /LENGTH=40 /DNA_ID= /DNA_START= /DNA_END= /DNA_ORIENTATION=
MAPRPLRQRPGCVNMLISIPAQKGRKQRVERRLWSKCTAV